MRWAPAITWMILLLAGCSSDGGGGVDDPVATPARIELSVGSADPMTSAGDTRVVTAVVKNGNGSVIPTPSVSWRSSAPSIATVAGSGTSATITAVDDGTAIITAASGAAEGTLAVTVDRRLVAIELLPPESVVPAGLTMQLTVVGRDARANVIDGLSGVTFATSDPRNVIVSPTGIVTALFSSFRPLFSIITATVTRDGATLKATKRIDVGSAEPAVSNASGIMLPEGIRPEPLVGVGDGIIYVTLDGDRVQYKMLWSSLTGPPVSAHIHGPEPNDNTVADVLVDLPLGDMVSTHGMVTGSFTATDIHPQDGRPAISLDSLVTLLTKTTSAYADMHTASFADGEIRGPIFPRP